MMQALLIFAAVLQPLLGSVHAEDWWLVSYGGAKPARMVVFVDKNSVSRTGDVVRAWEADYTEAGDGRSTQGYTKAQFEYDCAAKTFRTISLVDHHADGVAVDQAIGRDLAVPTSVPAGTMGDTEMKFACGRAVGAQQIGGGLDVAKVGRAILDGLDGSVASK